MVRPVSALLLVSVLALPQARAFERSRVDTDPDTALFWRHRTLEVHPAVDTCRDLDPAVTRAALLRSIDTWNTAADGCSDLRILDGGYPSAMNSTLFGAAADGENRIIWREEEWPDTISADTLALTTIIYRRSTGEILDADIDLNGVHQLFTVSDDGAIARTDVENTLTHELGHLIGLAHVPDPDATMFASSALGELDKRTLSVDDVAGLCTVYPEGRLTPGAPILDGRDLMGGCAVRTRQSEARRSEAPPLLLALSLCLLARRRRAARRAAPQGGKACASSGAERRRGASKRAPRARPR